MIKSFLREVTQKVGVDSAIGFTILARIIQAGGGIISIILISFFLSKEEQGYYYTFGSIIALQVFFELGLNGIITQYAAHESVHLEWLSANEVTGDKKSLSRLSSLLRFCLTVFGTLSLFLFIILIVSGYIFFTKYNRGTETVHWQMPWIFLVFSTSLMMVINPFFAFIEGLGKVKEVAKIRFVQQVVTIVALILVFTFKGGLMASGLASFVSVCVLAASLLFSPWKKLLLYIYHQKGGWKIEYWKEIFPYQYKIALSWISGYFIFQLFNPVLFATEGPLIAGQMGMTLQALNGISSLSMSWISTKIPLFSSLIAKKAYIELDKIFNKTLVQLSLVNSFLIVFFIFFLIVLGRLKISLAYRFLPILPIVLLCGVTFINQFIFSWSTYLRCHKQEPFLINSIVGGVLCALSTLFLGAKFGLMGIVLGYTVITLLGIPWVYYIFKTKKREWH
jgi:O-antigen/teichoic acid export membrane protein